MIFKKRPDLGNSIYQQKGSAPGLTVKNGMLINNMPDGMTGIQQAASIKKSMKRMEKVSLMAEGYAMGERMNEMNEKMMGGGSCD